MYDGFELSGIKLSDEQKDYFKKFDAAMQGIIAIAFSADACRSLKEEVRKLSKYEPFKGNKKRKWCKQKFYD